MDMKDDAIHAKAISHVETALGVENLAVVGILGAIVHTTTEPVDMGGTTLAAGNYCFVEVKVAVPV
jgi:hypothetical protein